MRLEELRRLVPNVMFQMLVRGANAVGYTNYPDDVVERLHRGGGGAPGMDVFRIFDALNDVDNMQVAIEAAQKTGRIVETAICYTGDVSDPRRKKYDLKYYVDLAKEIVRRGTHLLAIKDMAGLLKPRAATMLVEGAEGRGRRAAAPAHARHLRQQHRRRIMAAIEAGVDVVDGAVSSMAGMTSQPSLSSLAFALAGSPRDPGIDPDNFEQLSKYWEPVRVVLRAVRVGPGGARRRRLRARDPGRPVLEPARAGRGAGRARWIRRVGRREARLRRRQPAVRRHPQGHAVVEGGRRHGDLDGQAGAGRARGDGARARADLPGVGDRLHARRRSASRRAGSRSRCARRSSRARR